MTLDEKLKEVADLHKKVEKWDERLTRLATRKKNPLTETAFCDKHGFHKAGLNRNKKSVESGKNFPTKKTIEKVEAALKKERV